MNASMEASNAPTTAPKKKFAGKQLSADEALLKDIKIKTGICKRWR